MLFAKNGGTEAFMRYYFLKKCLAVVTSCLVLTAGMAVLPVVGSAESNLISNSTFDTGTKGWSFYKESGGSGSLGTADGKLALNVTSVGTLNYSVQMGYSVIPLFQNGVYRLKFDISSTADRTVEAMIQQNGGTYQAYTWKELSLTSQTQTVDYTFTMKQETDIMAKLCFNCGNEGEELPEHTIYLDNVSLELIDDSKVNYGTSDADEPSIAINQVGYKPESEKIAIFRDVTDEKEFSVVNADTKETVYTGELYGEKKNFTADETNWFGDFSKVTSPGKYYIKCGNLKDSYTFEIGNNVYTNLLDDSVRMLYLQRCGTEINDETFGHVACHNTKAKVYGTSDYIDVTGGWHDAGDYGRYVVPAAKAVADLLYAYDANPDLYSDNIGIPESGNGIPDILDETRYELEWMLKMQSSSGGVYHKVTCENFPGYVMPENETEELIVTPVSTTATANFCASMAMAYEFYKEIDKDFAQQCLSAAENAWTFLENNTSLIFKNPEDITTGAYNDSNDGDERYWAAAQMYRATGESKYLDKLNSMYAKSGLDWSTVGDYGNIALLTMEGIDKNSGVYTNAKNTVIKEADKFKKESGYNSYPVSVSSFNWGSNMTIANAGVILGLAYGITGDESYNKVAEGNLNYLLGNNPNGVCYVTGYGTVSPKNPHHRPSMAKKTAMKCMLVGGVNSALEDDAAKAYLAKSPKAKCYIDHSESYSTNEIAIYWNSPLTYLLSLTDNKTADETLKGDVNLDEKVTVSDAVLLQKYLAGSETLTDEQLENSDMNDDDKVNVIDLIMLKREIIKNSGSSNPGTDPTEPVTTTITTVAATKQTTTATTVTTKQETESNGSPNENATMFADFRKGETPLFYASDGWSNGSMFNCVWRKSNTSFDSNALNLTINNDTSGQYQYSGAEYRTNDFYGYGYYETSMKAIKNDGVVSSFFTYTGPSDNNPWDEIDVEILGKDTTKVQFNYFTNGKGEHEYMYDLGFDASQGFHTYGFDWQSDHITWYVDGKAVHTVTNDIPSTPSKIMMNVWPGTGVDSWLNAYDGKTPLTASYEWVTYNNMK